MTENNGFPQGIKGLITHQHPDLDAILSIHLFRVHGGQQFPGVETAPIQFVSANNLPGGKSAAELEAEGYIALDTGGGRFDTHPVEGESNEEKWESCAAALVAETLGVTGDPRYRFLLPYTLNHDARGQSLTSKEATHHLLAPHGLVEGLHRTLEDDNRVVAAMCRLLEGLAVAGTGQEPPLAQTAALFDRTLAAFLRDTSFTDTNHLRKELPEWPSEGESHRAARELGLAMRRDLEKLLKAASSLLAGVGSALPELELERRIQLTHALVGLANLHGEGSEAFSAAVHPLFQAAVTREADWFQAIDEVERSAKVIRGRGITLVAIASRNGLSIKAARYRRGAQAVLYYEPGRGSVTLQSGIRPDGTPWLNLSRIASRLRAAEIVKRHGNGRKAPRNLGEIGLVEDWFLHPSLKLLNRGSPKAQDVEPSALSWPEMIEIVRSDLKPDEKMPDWFCPPDRCTEANCTFYTLRLANCHAHRGRIRETPQTGTLGDLFADKFHQAGASRKKKRK